MNKIWITIILILVTTNVMALRISRPPTLSFPINADQISHLNKFLEDTYNIENGRYELDVVTTPKTNAKNGEMWIIYTAPTAKIQFKARGVIWTTQ